MARDPVVRAEEAPREDPGPLEQAVADAPAVLAVDLREIVDVEEQQGERVLVPERALDFLRQRELEHRRGDQRRQRVADGERDVAARDLLGVRAEDLERGAADRVRDERPRARDVAPSRSSSATSSRMTRSAWWTASSSWRVVSGGQ